MRADPRARWAEQLAVPVDAPPDEVAAAFLRALPGDLLPPAEHVLAASGLIGHALPTGRANALAEVLDADLEAFAARYWRLQPAERLLEWDALSRRGANRVRLCELEPGLDVTAPTLDDPVAEELAEQFRVLFALPPRERAVRRVEWLLTRADNIGRWRSALAVVQRDAPALVALEPRLRTALDATIDPGALAAGAREAPVNTGVDDFVRRLRQPGARAASGGDGASGKWFGGGAIVLVIVVVRLISAVGSSSNSKPNYEPVKIPPYTGPMYSQPGKQDPVARNRFTQTEIDSFQRYERDLAAGKNPPAPPATPYAAWVLADRPPNATSRPGEIAWPQLGTFTPTEVAACELYEILRIRDPDAVPPAVYEKWRDAGRPPAQNTGRPTALPEPGPNARRVYLNSFLIAGCQRYEQTGRLRPDQYDDWVRAGKPSEPGNYTIPKQPAQP